MQVKYRIQEFMDMADSGQRVPTEYYTGCVYITVNPEVRTVEEYRSCLLRAAVTLRNALPRVQRLGNNTFYTMLTPQEGDASEWASLATWAIKKDMRRYHLPSHVQCMTSRRKHGEALDALLLRAARACRRCTA